MEALKDHCNGMYKEMESKLFSIRSEYPEAWDWSKASIEVTSAYMVRLKDYIQQHPFKWRSEEVFFFRNIKPLFLKKAIFFSEVWNMEMDKPLPPNGKEDLLNFICNQQNKLEEFFVSNSFLYDYYRDHQDYMDFKLFVRQPSNRFRFCNIPLKVLPMLYYGDAGFSTGYDYLFAQFKAFEKFKMHLQAEYDKALLLTDKKPTLGSFSSNASNFDELTHLFKKVTGPHYLDTGQVMSLQDISIIIHKFRSYPQQPAKECALHQLISETAHLPDRLKEVVLSICKEWENETKDIPYQN
ncbi:Tetracycline resistance element mobilization regulatory protein rteC [Arcticibacter svalbardensis MN12-7]|uniref:Tetracycline resistance element mobilization regulatory protein rteC n=1 Tax=Arcticibacter svalbardensis MN12-7 TaxID=1150600 RepID=R9GRW5_9SPHI|nr:RteC domain-containing protein [Arcticibacter svalbardensis]EOR94285.1 Tetracycline resistance element mobilization regulatory protein rteC [Arcticibacter svalbardensis MN12-7]